MKRGPYKKKIYTDEQLVERAAKKADRLRKYAEANKEKIAANRRKWRTENKEKINAYKSAEYSKSPEKFKAASAANRAKRTPEQIAAHAAYIKRYHEEHKEAVNAAKRKWHEAHREESRKKADAWFKVNPEKRRDFARRRRAEQSGVGAEEKKTIVEWERKWRNARQVRCYWCEGSFKPEDCHLDHIHSRPACRRLNLVWHCISNVCVSCAPCNLKKNSSSLDDWNKKLESPTLL
jgi:hypothetical protein